MDREIFTYTPLKDAKDQIRLLRIHPGDWDDDIHCDLEELHCFLETYDSRLKARQTARMKTYDACLEESHAILDTHVNSMLPSWTAISYTWGSPQPLSAIFVNGKTLMVRQNCLYVLKQIRHRGTSTGRIWLDAICINQDDLAEKGSQVMMMGMIYEHAECVLSCVGPMTETIEPLFDAAEEISSLNAVNRVTCWSCSHSKTAFRKEELHMFHTWLDSIDSGYFQRFMKGFYAFGKIDYWERLWIMQEIILGERVYILCGRRQISFDDARLLDKMLLELESNKNLALEEVLLAKGFHYINLSLPRQKNAFSRMCEFATQWAPNALDLTAYLKGLRAMKCYDARDRVYGLLSLLAWRKSSGPPMPNYTVAPEQLAIDVLGRIRLQEWRFSDLRQFLQVIGVDTENARWDLTKSRPDSLKTDIIAETDRSAMCECRPPLDSAIAIRLDCYRFATLLARPDGSLHATIAFGDRHVRLEVPIQYSHSCDRNESTMLRSHDQDSRIAVPSARAGDILVNLEGIHHFDQTDLVSMYYPFLILRENVNQVHEIIGQIDLYGQAFLCPDSAGQQCPLTHLIIYQRYSLYLSAEDAINYALRRPHSPDSIHFSGDQSHNNIQRFCHERYSSFAHRNTGLPYDNDGVPNTNWDLDSCPDICARCGASRYRSWDGYLQIKQ